MMTSKSWQPTIVTINENGGCGTSSAVADKSSRFPHKMIFNKADADAVKENGDAMLDNGVPDSMLINNNRTTTMLMTPN